MIPTPNYKTIDDYIFVQPEEHRANLELIRNTIKSTVPEAVEVISYQMPAFKYHGVLCYFAVFKDHYSLFVSPKTIEAFSGSLLSYKTTKGTIHFSFKEPVPFNLIEEIVRFVSITNLEKAGAKKSKPKKR
jgi:uncharacterized protein YdhG (YjbR/CyaY superfamily)